MSDLKSARVRPLYPPLIANVDILLLGVRWVIIFLLGLLSWYLDQPTSLAPSITIWGIIVAYNIPMSVYILRTRPVFHQRIGWLLIGDLIQGFVSVVLTGGYRSFYFFWFLLTAVELSLIVQWTIALLTLAGIAALEAISMSWNLAVSGDPDATYLFVGKLTISVLVGGIAIVLGELIRREMAAQQVEARRALRVTALNKVMERIAQSQLDSEAVLSAILTGTSFIPYVSYALILSPTEEADTWKVAASTTPKHPPGERIHWPLRTHTQETFFICGSDQPYPLPAFSLRDNIRTLVGVRLQTPEKETLALLVLGWTSEHSVTQDEKLFLLTLAQEAGLGLRNARLYAKEQAHIEQLKRFQEMQATFFSALSHELKTPLAVLKMLVPAFRRWEEIAPTTRKETLETIEQNLTRLERLINEILESARLEAGVIQPYVSDIDMVQLCNQALEEVSPLAANKQIRLDFQSPPESCIVEGDRQQLKEVISNLLANAIKFSPHRGHVNAFLKCDADRLLFCVEDEGPGVSDEDKERIFDKFYTAVHNKALAGTGLGLFISREFVRMHHGRIWVEDRDGGGSRFCFAISRHHTREGETHDGESDEKNPGH